MVQEMDNRSNGYAVETEDLWRVYKTGALEVPALRGVNLKVVPGRFAAVKGRSGSGKTTLLNCIGGLDHPTSGVVRVFGRDISGWRERPGQQPATDPGRRAHGRAGQHDRARDPRPLPAHRRRGARDVGDGLARCTRGRARGRGRASEGWSDHPANQAPLVTRTVLISKGRKSSVTRLFRSVSGPRASSIRLVSVAESTGKLKCRVARVLRCSHS
jgi:energy-coupling factor transporter ATP-binding protein EcfA2